MLKKIINIAPVMLHPKLLIRLISMFGVGYLFENGWINSYLKKMPVDRAGNPLPWVTYSYLDFIVTRLSDSFDIFEFGSGNSTLWLSRKVNSVVSVEHSPEWYGKVCADMPENCSLLYESLVYGGDYSRTCINQNKNFHLILVDGRDRNNCIKNSIGALHSNGVIVLDDSERINYSEGIDFLISNGFRRIDFWGVSPGLFYRKSTTVFYRNNNCLGI